MCGSSPATSNAVQYSSARSANPRMKARWTSPTVRLRRRSRRPGAFDGLFLGLGAVALLVGAVGVADIMIISVLEPGQDRTAPRSRCYRGRHPRSVPGRSLLLALIGGAVGVGAGALSTAIDASSKHELVVIPALAWGGGMGAAILIGAVAGLWPAPAAQPACRPPKPCGACEAWSRTAALLTETRATFGHRTRRLRARSSVDCTL